MVRPMKILSTLVCAALVALFVPACATAPKQPAHGDSCCAAKGKCDAPATKQKH